MALIDGVAPGKPKINVRRLSHWFTASVANNTRSPLRGGAGDLQDLVTQTQQPTRQGVIEIHQQAVALDFLDDGRDFLPLRTSEGHQAPHGGDAPGEILRRQPVEFRLFPGLEQVIAADQALLRRAGRLAQEQGLGARGQGAVAQGEGQGLLGEGGQGLGAIAEVDGEVHPDAGTGLDDVGLCAHGRVSQR